jgi:hypothetical protein
MWAGQTVIGRHRKAPGGTGSVVSAFGSFLSHLMPSAPDSAVGCSDDLDDNAGTGVRDVHVPGAAPEQREAR